jgi:hypothetical protein
MKAVQMSIVIAGMTLLLGTMSPAWEVIYCEVPAENQEATWRDALAEDIQGKTEFYIEGGRIDVLTQQRAIELDWPHKWHEGLGQALHYAYATGKRGTLALIERNLKGPEELSRRSRERFELIEDVCRANNIDLFLLFPRQNVSQSTQASHIETR